MKEAINRDIPEQTKKDENQTPLRKGPRILVPQKATANTCNQ